MIDDFTLSPWVWAAAAVALAGIEVIAPGVFMIWLAGAAAATALVGALLAPGWIAQVAVFAAFATISVILARRLIARPRSPAEPGLNRRAERMIGTLASVAEPILAGHGRVQIGDAPWPATGPDLPAGARVRIVAVNGTTVEVSRA